MGDGRRTVMHKLTAYRRCNLAHGLDRLDDLLYACDRHAN
jgi:hypothetical protein